jgi:hypothetical protein
MMPKAMAASCPGLGEIQRLASLIPFCPLGSTMAYSSSPLETLSVIQPTRRGGP